MKKTLIILSVFLGFVVLSVGALYLVMRKMHGPLIHAVDYDPYLTTVARTATPLIQTLERYHEEHHHYPMEASEVDAALGVNPDERFASWTYTPATGDSYDLYHKLDWDPALLYQFKNHEGHWVYGPGDGSPEKPLKLNP